MSLNVRNAQREALKKAFRLHVAGAERPEDQFKVLIFDRRTVEIIRTLFTRPELNELGVTTCVQLETSRDTIPDAPALYFVEPTEDNVDRICKDLTANLYDRCYLSFATSIPKELITKIAQFAASNEVAHKVFKIYDEFTDIVCYEDRLFSLNLNQTFKQLNDKSASDTVLQGLCSRIVDGLFCALVTMKCIPIIRTPNNPNMPAYQIARMLFKKLQDHLQTSKNLFNNAAYQRPLLVLLDRSEDLAILLHHGCTYQAMINDLLDTPRTNQVQVPSGDQGVTKTFDLDDKDEFWSENQGKGFPEVVDAHTKLLAWCKSKEDEIKGVSPRDPSKPKEYEDTVTGIQKMMQNVMTLPQLNDKKKMASLHTDILHTLTKHINERAIDDFYNHEENFMGGSFSGLKELKECIDSSQRGSVEDKLRAFLVYHLCKGDTSKADLDEMTRLLQGHEDSGEYFNGDTLRPLSFVNTLGNLHSVMGQKTSSDANDVRTGSTFMDNLLGMGKKVVNKLLPKNKNCTVTKIVHNLLNSHGVEQEEYQYFDPAARSGAARHRSQMRDAIVFVIGGGNHTEFQNLQDYAEQRAGPSKKTIIYGTTDLIAPSEFLQTLNELS